MASAEHEPRLEGDEGSDAGDGVYAELQFRRSQAYERRAESTLKRARREFRSIETESAERAMFLASEANTLALLTMASTIREALEQLKG